MCFRDVTDGDLPGHGLERYFLALLWRQYFCGTARRGKVRYFRGEKRMLVLCTWFGFLKYGYSRDIFQLCVFYSTLKFLFLTKTRFLAYDIQASARYFSDGVGSSLPNSLPFICLAESLSGKSCFAITTISSSFLCGSSASTMSRITSSSASI